MATITFINPGKRNADALFAGTDGIALSDLLALANTNHIQDRNLYAVVNDSLAYKLADQGYGSRVTNLGTENTTTDPVTITAHGLTSNNTLGDLTNGGVGYAADWGFGVDNAPESGNRWINTGDSLTFAVNDITGRKQQLTSLSFIADTNGASAIIALDVDGATVRQLLPGQLVGSTTRWTTDAKHFIQVQDGDKVDLNFESGQIRINGIALAQGLSAEFLTAFANSGSDQITIGARREDNTGFSIKDLMLETRDFNSAPVIGAADVASTIIEDVSASGSGLISFSDANVTDIHSVTATPVGPGTGSYLGAFTATLAAPATGGQAGSVTWNFTVNNDALQFLAEGESRTQVYRVTIDDGKGGVATRDVTLTIQGTNDRPEIVSVSGDKPFHQFVELNGALATSGTVTVLDRDASDVVTVSNPAEPPDLGVRIFLGAVPPDVNTLLTPGAGLSDASLQALGFTRSDALSYFTFAPTNDPNGTSYAHDGTAGTLTWTFDSNDQAFDFLAEGEILSIYYYSLRPDDGRTLVPSGDGAILIRVVGTNDAPHDLALVDSGNNPIETLQVVAGATDVDLGTVVATDPDEATALTFAVSDGPFTIGSDGTLRFSGEANFPVGTILEVTVTATDSAGASTSRTYSLEITEPQSGVALDGYIAGATIFADADGDGVQDAAEASTVTDNLGRYTLEGGTGTLILRGGIDISTGQPFTGELRAPSGSSVVTPLTTLVATVAGPAATPGQIAAAQATVVQALGLPTGTSILDLDPVVATLSDDPAVAELGVSAMVAAVQVQNTIAQVTAALVAAGADEAAATEAALSALSDALDGTTDYALTSQSGVESLLTSAAAGVSAEVSANLAAASEDVAAIIAASNTVAEDAATLDGSELLVRLAQVGAVAQGDAADAIADVVVSGGDQATVDQFTGAQLLAQVGNVDVSSLDVDGAESGDTINGTAGNDPLNGYGGADVIYGNAGNDTLDGGTGNDSLYGGPGFDTYIGGPGNDFLQHTTISPFENQTTNQGSRADYSASSGPITASLGAVSTVTGPSDVGTDTLERIHWIVGSSGNDTMSAASDFKGPDGSAFSEFEGGPGDDHITGIGVTRIGYLGAKGGVHVDLGKNTATSLGSNDQANIGNDVLIGTFTDVRGSTYGDSLVGADDPRFETFRGQRGDDTIDGRGGSSDRADYRNSMKGIKADTVSGYIEVEDGWDSKDKLYNIEQIRGSLLDDTIAMDGGNNRLIGMGGNDKLYGRGGIDILVGGEGNDLIDGGDGYDVAQYAFDASVVSGIHVLMAEGKVTGGHSGATDTLSGIEEVQGTDFQDTYDARDYQGTSGPYNQFLGMGGDDTVYGNGQTMVSYFNATGGVEIDLATGATGNVSVGKDTFFGGVTGASGSSHADKITGDVEANVLWGQSGNDTLRGNEGSDNIDGGAGSDTAIYSGVRSEYLVSQIGANGVTITHVDAGSDGSDQVFNVETFKFTDGVYSLAELQSGPSNLVDGGAGNDNLPGTAAGDLIRGLDGDDNLQGLEGNDILQGAGGNDALDGGAGSDTVVQSGARRDYDIAFSGSNAFTITHLNGGTDGFDQVSNVEFIQFSDGRYSVTDIQAGPTNFRVGGPDGDFLEGTSERDLIQGSGGDDRLIGFQGNDTLDGGSNGQFGDIADYVRSTGPVTVRLWAGWTDDDGYGNTDRLISIESIAGSRFNDNIQLDDNNNWAQLIGGSDTVDGRGGFDVVFYELADFAVTVNLAQQTATYTVNDTPYIDTLISFEAVHGTSLDDKITLTEADNYAFGRAGNDTLEGLGGRDRLHPGSGSDKVDGGFGDDTLVYTEGDSSDAPKVQGADVNLLDGTAIDPWGGTDQLISIENVEGSELDDRIVGNGGNNRLSGFGGHDALIGGAGNDVLDGGEGNDSLEGGTGFNRFIGGAGNDTMLGGSQLLSNDDGNQAEYSAANEAITVTLGASSKVEGGASVGTDAIENIETIIGTRHADTYTVEDGFSGQLYGKFNEFEGGDGNDKITGNGNTRVSYRSADGAVQVDLKAGKGEGFGASGAKNVGVDTFLTGNLSDGANGVTEVRGSAHADSISGSDGDWFESFRGQGGNDTIDGGGGSQDRADYRNSPTGIFATFTALGEATVSDGFLSGSASGIDTLKNIEQIRGSEFADVISMDDGANTVVGMGGNDKIWGRGGDDSIVGGSGNDELHADYGAVTGVVSVDTLDGGIGDDRLIGSDNTRYLFGLNSGQDKIENWQPAALIDLQEIPGLPDVATFIAANVSQVGTDTLINLGGGNTITLVGVSTANLTEANFLLSVSDLPPNASPVTLPSIAEDSGPLTISADQLKTLGNVSDPNGTETAITDLTLLSGQGTLSRVDTATWQYTPAPNDDTEATFAYTASSGGLSASSMATLDLVPVNDAPTFAIETATKETWLGGRNFHTSIAVQSDGKIVVATSDGQNEVLRFNPDGSPDITYDYKGAATSLFGGPGEPLSAVAIDSAGRAIVVGTSNGDFAVGRFLSNGQVDSTFGSGGMTLTTIGSGTNAASAVTIDALGRIVVAGRTSTGSATDIAIARYSTDGTLDHSFGQNGIITQDLGGITETARSVVTLPDGSIVVASSTWGGVALTRYAQDGTIDPTFGSAGISLLSLPGMHTDVEKLIALHDGKFLLTGYANTTVGTSGQAVIAKFLSDGTPDPSFGAGGVVLAALGPDFSFGYDVIVDDQGRILVAGQARDGASVDAVLARFDQFGALDTTFGNDGSIIVDVSDDFNYAAKSVIQSDGKILLIGRSAENYMNNQLTLTRFNSDGSPDLSFSQANTLGGTVHFQQGQAPVVLDGDATVSDVEGDFSGATLTIARQGSANTDDTFSSTLIVDDQVIIAGTLVGTVSASEAGTLSITFNAASSAAAVNEVVRSVTYSNTAPVPPASVVLEWTFQDGGTPPALATSVTTVNITPENPTPISFVSPENYGSATFQPSIPSSGPGVLPNTYSISGPDAAYFQSEGGIISYQLGFVPNFELPKDQNNDNIYELTYSVFDPNMGETSEYPLQIQVTDVSETIAFVSGGSDITSTTQYENVDLGIPGSNLSGEVARIEVRGDHVSWNPGNTAVGVVSSSLPATVVDYGSGQVFLAISGRLDYEAQSQHTIVVGLFPSDPSLPHSPLPGAAPEATATFVINVLDGDDPPTDLLATDVPASVREDASAPNGLRVATLNVVDDEFGYNEFVFDNGDRWATQDWEVRSTADINRYELYYTGGLDYETRPVLTQTVSVRQSEQAPTYSSLHQSPPIPVTVTVAISDTADTFVDGGPFEDSLGSTTTADYFRGYAGADIIDGGPGNDVLDGGTDNDILTGGSGSDVFVFAPGYGEDLIVDFSGSLGSGDQVDIAAFGVSSFAELSITGDGSDVILSFTAGDTLRFAGLEPSDLNEQDFVYWQA
jgi:uncharacterized delta-60 repeat protein